MSANAGSLPADRPWFDPAEVRTISRNELLSAVLTKDPWLVRRILDVAAAGQAGAERVAIESLGVDPDFNPDLVGTRRDAWGSVQWINLLKRAKAEKDGLLAPVEPKATQQNRSSEGSVELIDMAKRAKAAKQAAQQ